MTKRSLDVIERITTLNCVEVYGLGMKSVTSFLRRKGYAIREIRDLLCQLDTRKGAGPDEFPTGGTLDKVLEYLRSEPAVAKLSRGRGTLKEHGITPVTEHGHTLRVPISAKPGVPRAYLCFTRVAADKWVYFVEAQNGDSHVTVHH